MKKLLIIPILFLFVNSFGQQVDSLLGVVNGHSGKLIKDTAITIATNYITTPTTTQLSFDSNRVVTNLVLNGTSDSLYVYKGEVKVAAIPLISTGAWYPDSAGLYTNAAQAEQRNHLTTTATSVNGIAITNNDLATTLVNQYPGSLTLRAQGYNTTLSKSVTMEGGFRFNPNKGATTGAINGNLELFGTYNGTTIPNIMNFMIKDGAYSEVGVGKVPAYSGGLGLDVSGGVVSSGSFTTPKGLYLDGTNFWMASNSGLYAALQIGAGSSFPTAAIYGTLTVGSQLKPQTTAILDLSNTTTKGFVPPALTTIQRNVLSSGVVNGIITTPGSGYTNSANVKTLTGGSGSGATATITVVGGVVTKVDFSPSSSLPGSGYQIGDVLSVASFGGGSGFTYTVTSTGALGLQIFNTDTRRNETYDGLGNGADSWKTSGASIGQTTLVSGTNAIIIKGLSSTSLAFVTQSNGSGDALTTKYQAVCSANTVTINAITSAGNNTINTADGSTLNYQVYQ